MSRSRVRVSLSAFLFCPNYHLSTLTTIFVVWQKLWVQQINLHTDMYRSDFLSSRASPVESLLSAFLFCPNYHLPTLTTIFVVCLLQTKEKLFIKFCSLFLVFFACSFSGFSCFYFKVIIHIIHIFAQVLFIS